MIEVGQSTVNEVQKSQILRVWDVLFLAPFMIMLARKKSMSDFESKVLMACGILTAVYNANNWAKNKVKENE
jgi:hypothetical protein